MALELREAIGALTATWSRLGHEIGFGIGIAHGFATLPRFPAAIAIDAYLGS
jgi:adenylate cyclase